MKLSSEFFSVVTLQFDQQKFTQTHPVVVHYLQWEGDGVVAVARQEVGEYCFHGGFFFYLAVSWAQQVSVKYICQWANAEIMPKYPTYESFPGD